MVASRISLTSDKRTTVARHACQQKRKHRSLIAATSAQKSSLVSASTLMQVCRKHRRSFSESSDTTVTALCCLHIAGVGFRVRL